MDDLTCSPNPAEAEDMRASWSELSRLMGTPAHPRAPAEQDKSTPYLCMRLMCSQNRAEIDAVRDELTKAGILTETRNNPMAEALGVNGLELWVQDERDFFNAANLFARMQAPAFLSSAKANGAALPDDSNEPVPRADHARSSLAAHAPETDKTKSWLEAQLEEMLESESQLANRRAMLRKGLQEWAHALVSRQVALTREIADRTAVERKQAEELAELRSALKRELAESLKAKQQRERETDEWQQKSKAREEILHQTQEKLLSQARQIQSQEATVAKLRAEIAELERQWEEDDRSLCKLREELALERQARCAAEQGCEAAEKRVESAVAVQRSLEKQLLEQKQLEQDFRAHVATLSQLFDKMGPRTASAAPDRTHKLSQGRILPGSGAGS